jgi:hypothetical protein
MNETIADRVADLFENDGQVFVTRSGQSFDRVCIEFGAKVEHGISVWNNETQSFDAYWESDGDVVRFLFPDGSALVVSGGAWDIEGQTPFSWSGLL